MIYTILTLIKSFFKLLLLNPVKAIKTLNLNNFRVLIKALRLEPRNEIESNFNKLIYPKKPKPKFNINSFRQGFKHEGHIDSVNAENIKGWLNKLDNNENGEVVKIYINEEFVGTCVANEDRADLLSLGKSNCGFTFPFPTAQNFEYPISIKASSKDGSYITNEIVLTKAYNYNNMEGNFDRIDSGIAIGWARNIAKEDERLKIILRKSGRLIASGTAEMYRADLHDIGKGDGKYGFRIKIPIEEIFDTSGVYEATLENGIVIGKVILEAGNRNILPFDLFEQEPELHLPINNGKLPKLSTFDKKMKIGVHVHCYYLDVFYPMVKRLLSLPAGFNLFISTNTDEKKAKIIEILSEEIPKTFKLDFKVEVFPNQGRDVAPMIVGFREEIQKCDVVLHIHTKKSAHREDLGEIWLDHCLDSLFRDSYYVRSILNLFDSDKSLGIVAPTDIEELKIFKQWGANRRSMKRFLLDIDLNPNFSKWELDFPVGTMFWFRPEAINQLFGEKIDFEYFPKEPIAVDGTVAHAIERLIFNICEQNNFNYRKVSPVSNNLVHGLDNLKVSIVMPIYNSEAWIDSSIQSILNQQEFYEPFEVLLIDNNSSDRSSEICKFYSESYPNISYYLEKDQGPGHARNLGIKKAKGDYIMFFDSDDLLFPTALKDIYDSARESNADMICSPLLMFSKKTISKPLPIMYSHYNENLNLEVGQKYGEMEKKILDSIFSDFGSCAKLYLRTFLNKNKINFPTGAFEDNLFMYDTYLTAKRIQICSKPTLFYRKMEEEKGKTWSTKWTEKVINEQSLAFKALASKLPKIKRADIKTVVQRNIARRLKYFFNEIEKLPKDKKVFNSSMAATLVDIPKSEITLNTDEYADLILKLKKSDFRGIDKIFDTIKQKNKEE